MKCRMIPSGSGYKVVTPYNGGFITALKNTVPAASRVYDRNTRCWDVSAQYSRDVVGLIHTYFGETVTISVTSAKPLLGIIEVLYLGKTKDRGNGQKTAFGWSGDGWNVIFPENVLKAWFDPSLADTEQKSKKPKTTTYYETLSIRENATAEDIKKGYRRMVLQWHPDVCKDPDANEVFLGIQKAYEILSNPKTKARYDVGLKMASTVKAEKPEDPLEKMMEQLPYRAPLKCGNLLCEYIALGMKKSVSKILQWEDIYNEQGKVLVSSWKMGDEEPTLNWR